MIKECRHPTLGILVRSDGAVFLEGKNNRWKPRWSYGHNNVYGYKKIKVNGKSYSVHRIVAEKFLENVENKPSIDHINRDKTDNRVENLRWATYSEQQENHPNFLDRDRRITIRQKDDPNGYRRQYNALNREKVRAYQRAWCAKKKEVA